MIERHPSDEEIEVEYYLIDGEELARIQFDRRTDEYFDAEMMDALGDWHDCPPNDILMDGDEITEFRARELVRRMGGTLHDHE